MEVGRWHRLIKLRWFGNAQECIGWARTARTKKEREIFFQIARTWLEAAERAAERDGLPEICAPVSPAGINPPGPV